MFHSELLNLAEEIKILIIEDDLEQAGLLQETLGKLKYTVFSSTDGEILLELTKQFKDLIVLLDYNLEDTTGEDVMKNCIEKLGRIPYFIVMTAYGNEKVAVNMMKLGAMDYIVKDPNFYEFLPSVINNAINTVLKDKRLEDTENSLKEINGRFVGLFQNSKDGIYFTTLDGQILAYNPAMIDMFGYSSDELKSLNSSSLYYYNKDRDAFREEILRKGFVNNFEVILKRKDGTPINCILVTSLKKDKSNNIVGYDGIIHDITERKQAESKLQISEERYRNLFERVPVGVYRSTPAGEVIDANPVLVKMMGAASIEELMKQNVMEFYKNPLDRLSWKNLIESNEIIYNYEVELKTFDGRIIWVNDSSRAISDNSNILYYEGVIEDVTERKNNKERLDELVNDLMKSKNTIEKQILELNKLNKKLLVSEKELIQLNASKDKFFSIIAHDLKSPFSGFLGVTAMLSEDIDEMEKPEIQEMATALHNSSRYIYELLQNLLNWSKVQGGIIEIKHEPINLNEIFQDNVGIIRGNAEQKNINVIVEINEDITAYFDTNVLNTVIRNLLANAVKFTYQGGTISLSANRDNNSQVVISVKDNGVGINTESLSNLFKIDVQNRITLGTSNEKGTGLGLILCKELLGKCNTEMIIETEEGRGSKFSFAVPTVDK